MQTFSEQSPDDNAPPSPPEGADVAASIHQAQPNLFADDSVQAEAPQARLKARRLRLVELVLVLFVAFAMPIYTSLYTLLISGRVFKSIPNGASSVSFILYEVSGLAVLGYVLFRREQRLDTLVRAFSWRDIPASIGLLIAVMIAASVYQLAWRAVFSTQGALGQSPKLVSVGGISAAVVLFLIVNALFEELIARAFTITEIEFLTGKTSVAVAISVLMQASYHLYQGLASALATGVIFLFFSLYYVRTRRIWPVVLAHMFIDFLALAAGAAIHHPHK